MPDSGPHCECCLPLCQAWLPREAWLVAGDAGMLFDDDPLFAIHPEHFLSSRHTLVEQREGWLSVTMNSEIEI